MAAVQINNPGSAKHRARTGEGKRERREAIVDRARVFLAEHGFDDIRLADIAAELGLAKATIYLYFPTKQDLFASILREEMEAWWLHFLEGAAAETPGPDFGASFQGAGLLIRLMTSLHMSIEAGLSRSSLLELKSWFRDFVRDASLDIEARYPALRGKGPVFMLRLYALAVGGAQLAYPPREVAALIEAEDSLGLFRVDFIRFIAESIDAMYHGMTD